jgi:hypothetical protein
MTAKDEVNRQKGGDAGLFEGRGVRDLPAVVREALGSNGDTTQASDLALESDDGVGGEDFNEELRRKRREEGETRWEREGRRG